MGRNILSGRRQVLLVFGACLALAEAQIDIGNLPSAGECDLATLSARVSALQTRCCSGEAGDGCACTIPCASTLLPLLDNCRPTLDIMLDMDDGARDGVARQLDTLHEQCLAIPPGDVLAELATRKDAGTCSDETLNGVARTDVVAAPCVDTNQHCDLLVAGGLACGGPEMATDCKATCGTCDDGGGKRRAQIASSCPLKDFEDQASAVNAACCDDDACNGVPTACDAKCAVIFDEFFDRCGNILGLQMPDQMTRFTSLHTTCSQLLPVEPLLRAVIECDTQARVDTINANDFSSWDAMQAAGWSWEPDDSNFFAGDSRATIGGVGSTGDCGSGYYNFAGGESVGTLSLILPVAGIGTIDFGNCWPDPGMVVLAINGIMVRTADSSTESVVADINFHAGDVLTLQDQGLNSVIRLNSIRILPKESYSYWNSGSATTNAAGHGFTLVRMPAQAPNYFSADDAGAQRYARICNEARLVPVTTGTPRATPGCDQYNCMRLTDDAFSPATWVKDKLSPPSSTCDVQPSDKVDCGGDRHYQNFPQYCEPRGCCWQSGGPGAWCFNPASAGPDVVVFGSDAPVPLNTHEPNYASTPQRWDIPLHPVCAWEHSY